MHKSILLVAFGIFGLSIVVFIFIGPFLKDSNVSSNWVFMDEKGRLVYKTTPDGDKIMDFSHAGYMGGGIALPDVPAKKTITPTSENDHTNLIQSAINEVAVLPLIDGFRGAVQLAEGTYYCSQAIHIPVSGIVLRGSGSESTTIRMTGNRHTAIVIGNRQNENVNTSDLSELIENDTFVISETFISDKYVPVGSLSFHVVDAGGFHVGDRIQIRRPLTEAWVSFMEMDNLVRDGRSQTWIRGSHSGTCERIIKEITENKIIIDHPVSDSYNSDFLNPPGTLVTKIKPSSRVTQVGVEHLHIQCPPLEIAYGNAPYSGIRIGGDDCWVKDVFFEETMNTAVLAGNRNTLTEVMVKHTYPNLGASKPTDFSIEGSQNLIDRCHVSGGNTYFVWTGSLIGGPNVILNSTFSGHGSRIQPHMRWSTGMLVDNCVVPDGGIDFLNRGVAGSGHGWTMGWGVAWNCVAKTYVIQNPPGVINWAIGCSGTRDITPRLFESAPNLAEGVFDSHGQQVTPQSLYLAQLTERLGIQAIKNIGYSSNDKNLFKTVGPLPPLLKEEDPLLGENLALHRPINTSNVRGGTREFGGEKAVDGNPSTYWATDDGIVRATFELDTEGPLEINVVEISEMVSLGQRVRLYKIEGQVDSDWVLLSEGTSIGERMIHIFPNVIVWKVKLTIQDADDYPSINRIGLYLNNVN